MSEITHPKHYAKPTGSSLAYRGDVLVGWYCDSCDTLYGLSEKVCKHCLTKNTQDLGDNPLRLLTENEK